MTDFLAQLCRDVSSNLAAPVSCKVGSKDIEFPAPALVSGAPPNLKRTTGVFPDGGIQLRDFMKLLPQEFQAVLPASLPAPLDSVLQVELKGMTLYIDTDAKVVASIGVDVGFPSDKYIGVSKAHISNLVFSLFIGSPTDPLQSISAWVSGDLTLCGFAATTSVSTDGHVVILLNKGDPIDVQPVLQELASMGGLAELPFEAPKFARATLEFDLPFQNVRLSSDFQGATLKFLGLEATLLSLGGQVTGPTSVWASAELTIGQIRAAGFFAIPGEITLTITIPSLSPGALITQALPELAGACSIIDGIAFENTQITLTKLTGEQHKAVFSNQTVSSIEARDGPVLRSGDPSPAIGSSASDSVIVSTTIDISKHLPDGTGTFLGKIRSPIDLAKVQASVTLTDAPMTAQIQFALVSAACELVPKSEFKLTGLWFQANLAAANPALALAAAITFPFEGQVFELYGKVSVTPDEVDIDAQLQKPAVWTNALGIQSLDVSGLAMKFGWSFVDEFPTLGIKGSFSVAVPHTGSRFSGGVVFIIDGGNPGASVFGVNFNHFDLCEAYHLFIEKPDGSLDRLLREASLDDCVFYVAPEPATIGSGPPLPQGMTVRGKLDLFGWKAQVDVEVGPQTGLKFACDAENAIRIGNLLSITGDKSSAGPHLDFTTTPDAGQPYLTASARLSVERAFSAQASIKFSKTAFSFKFQESFFETTGVEFEASADLSSFSSGAFKVSLSLTGLNALADGITHALREGAKSASSVLQPALALVASAEAQLKYVDAERKQRQAALDRLVRARAAAAWWKVPYYEAQIVVVQGEVTTISAAYTAALKSLQTANAALEGVQTVENLALWEIAKFIQQVPIEIRSVTCTESLSALGKAAFNASIALDVNKTPYTFTIGVDFDAKDMVDTLARNIYQAIIDLF
jgi:hypothetical protein